MTTSAPRIRVAAYVVRHTTAGPQLLVFDQIGHPEAGTQIPAGGVAAGEPLRDAVIREVTEETGLTDIAVVGALGTEDKAHPTTGQPRHTTYFQLEAPVGAPDQWLHTVDGAGLDHGMQFACWFAPLPLSAHLADHQDDFLDRLDPRWVTRTDDGR